MNETLEIRLSIRGIHVRISSISHDLAGHRYHSHCYFHLCESYVRLEIDQRLQG